jgi:peroxidase
VLKNNAFFRVYHETRKLIGAMLQHITYNEWLPIILGPRVLEIFELKLLPKGYYSYYNDTVNPTIANAFASAAFRFGHSLVKNSLSRCNKEFREVPFFIKLHKELNNPSVLHNFGSVDRIILGLASKRLARRDEFIAGELTNHLFQVNKRLRDYFKNVPIDMFLLFSPQI